MAAVVAGCGGAQPATATGDARGDDDDASGGVAVADAAADTSGEAGPQDAPATACTLADASRCAPAADPECAHPACDGGQCAYVAAPAGTPLPTSVQTPGDCVIIVCDGQGARTTAAAPGDTPAAASDCMIGTCSGDVPGTAPKPDGTACALGICHAGTCFSSLCVDGVRDGDETGVDCGGSCAACAPGLGCAMPTDCTSGVCTSTVCAAPTCSDGVNNQSETDVDCGGTCPGCATGKACGSGADCASSVCTSTCQAPTCSDHAKNGDETGVDCGGGCPACAPGLGCSTATDCASGVCTSMVCAAPSCSDGVKNGTETAADCGGTCSGCAAGKACGTGHDCASGVCKTSTCQAPTCADGVRNGVETGMDCGGGGACPACPLTQGCAKTSDCVSSASCYAGRCAYASFDMDAAHRRLMPYAQAFSLAQGDFDRDGNLDFVSIAGGPSSTYGVVLVRGLGGGAFATPVLTATHTDPREVVVADFNGDGWPDVALAAYGQNNNGTAGAIAVHLNDGTGKLTTNVDYPAGVAAVALAAGDVDGDGHVDIVAAGYSALSVFHNGGSGAMTLSASLTAAYPEEVKLADVDGNGSLDIVSYVYDSSNGGIQVFTNDGKGHFGAAVMWDEGYARGNLQLADVDGDHLPDILVDDPFGVTLLLNVNGKFPSFTSVQSIWGRKVLGDVDKNGTIDLVVTKSVTASSTFDPTIAISLGHGDGTFAAPITVGADDNPMAVQLAEVDGDCLPDIVTTGGGGADSVVFDVYKAQAPAVFPDPSRLGFNTRGFVAADLNADHLVDLAGGYMEYGTDVGHLELAWNQGGGSMSYAGDTEGEDLRGAAAADLNGDGLADVVLVDKLNNLLHVHVNAGSQNLASYVTYATYAAPVSVAITDIDRNGTLDLVVACNGAVGGDGEVDVFLGDGHGKFGAKTGYPVTNPAAIVAADFNGDGAPDVATVSAGSTIAELLNDRAGKLGAASAAGGGGSVGGLAAADFDGDGSIDLAFTDASGPSVGLLLNAGGGAFRSASTFPMLAKPYDLAAGDLNGDGRPDLAVCDVKARSLSVLLNQGGGSFDRALDLVGEWVGSYSTDEWSFVRIADIDGDGKPDVVDDGLRAEVVLNRSGATAYVCH